MIFEPADHRPSVPEETTKKQIAIVGAGFCGLSLAYHLLEETDLRPAVTLFDAVGIGGGASGVATGLLHPYPGEAGRRSLEASDAMAATLRLLDQVEQEMACPVTHRTGILRIAQTDEQQETFLRHVTDHRDVDHLHDNHFLIRSGVTVDCMTYLKGLATLIKKRGGRFICRTITSLSELMSYDAIVLSTGAGSLAFPEVQSIGMKVTKGQVLRVQGSAAFPRYLQSVVGKGYLAPTFQAGEYILGSTYERNWDLSQPDKGVASQLILPKAKAYLPEVDKLEILECRAGIRIVQIKHYYPLAERLSSKIWALTAMGSRGLLYHAYLAEQLSHEIKFFLHELEKGFTPRVED